MSTPEMRFTPVHQETGISLSVFVEPADFTKSKARPHHTEHSAFREEVKDVYGRIMRYSRTQLIPDHLHNSGPGNYHEIFSGPENLPKTPSEKVKKMLLLLSGVWPRESIYLTGNGFEIRTLTDEEHAFISHPKITTIEARNPRNRQFRQRAIGHGIIKYALTQDIGDLVSVQTKNKFLGTMDRAREIELGNLIISTAINEAIRPAISSFERAQEQGMVDTRRLGIMAVVRNIVPKEDFRNYYEILRTRLTEAANVTTLPVELKVALQHESSDRTAQAA